MNTPDYLSQLTHDWRRQARGPASRCSTAILAERHRDLHIDGVEDLGEMVELLEPRSGRPVLWRAAVVAALLEEANDPIIRRALLQTLLPGVVSVCRKLRFGEGVIDDPREFFAHGVGLLDELLRDWAGQHRPYAAPDLLSALRGRLRRWMLKEKQARAYCASNENVDVEAPDASPLLTRLTALAGGPHERLARLTYARVFEGRSLTELARLDRISTTQLSQQLRVFAQHHLL